MNIIDNKRIDMSASEWELYQKICRSYDRPNFKGEELFKGLFETNGDGVITFVIPPEKQFSSIEVYLFLISIMQNQHLRVCHNIIDALVKETKENTEGLFNEVKKVIIEAKELLIKLKTVD